MYDDNEDEDLSPSASCRSFIERRIIVQVAANRDQGHQHNIMSPIEEVEEEQDPGSGFYTSVPSIPPENRDEQTETTKMVKRKISQIIVVYSDEIAPLARDYVCENDTPTMSDISVTKDASTCTTKDAFEGIQRRNEEREVSRRKKESDVEIFVENSDKYVRKKSPVPTLNRSNEKYKPPECEVYQRKNQRGSIDESKMKRCDEKQLAELATCSANTERGNDFKRLSCIPEIIIGEIDKEEATYLYDQILGVGRNFLDWLNVNHLSQSDYQPTTSQACQCQQQQEAANTSEQAKALQRKILSIEKEYNKLRSEQKANSDVRARKIDPCSSNKERNLPKQIRPREFSLQTQRIADTHRNNMRHDSHDDGHCPCLPHPTHIEPTSMSNRRNTRNNSHTEDMRCPCDIEKRLVKLEHSFKNHDGDFTNVIAELRSCLEYCNSQQRQREENNDDVIRARIAKLTDLVELHRKALDDWKVELCALKKNSNYKK